MCRYWKELGTATRLGATPLLGGSDVARNRILIVDDNADTVSLLEIMLSAEGYEDLVSTTDPKEVVPLCEEADPDLILLDLRMPRMDGFEVMEELRDTSGFEYRPILVLTAEGNPQARKKALALGARDFVTRPFDDWELLLRVRNLLETRELTQALRAAQGRLEETVTERTRDLWEALQKLERSQEELRLSREDTVVRLAIAAEFRDDETLDHVRRMSRYCGLLASKVGEDDGRSNLIRLASVMHDVGKIGIPDSILTKRGEFTHEERLVMEKHAEIGHRILVGSNSKLLQLAASISLTHHERYDGSGYPEGLVGDDIPREGRIAAIADVFDALTNHRTYRRRLSLSDAMRTMQEGRGTSFDPKLLDLFFDAIDEVLTIREAHPDEDERARAG